MNSQNTKKNKQYFLQDEMKIYFSSDFDSGNLERVEQLAPYIYKIYPAFDKNKLSTNKTFFHFKVYGFKMCVVKFVISRVQLLEKLLKKNQVNTYQPLFRKGQGQYKRIQQMNVQLYYNKMEQVQLNFTFQFGEDVCWHYFSFAYPYSYQKCYNLIKQLRQKTKNSPEIYFHDEILQYTNQQREIKLLTITDRGNCAEQRQMPIIGLFPNNDERPYKIDKPKVIISARVHPGETPASFCLEGLLRFLLNQKDYRSHLLRKNFHFIIIPMLNPDGVYNGHFRTDLNGNNLNRHYQNCSKNKHPSIWCFRRYLLEMKAREQCIAFFFDFHAHPSKKQFFIYGNAFNQFTQQVQAQTFGKLLENNCPYFHNVDSIFHQKQMKAKDKLDAHSKEGCARVYIHKLFNLVHSYTVQCGYYSPGKLNKLNDMLNNAQFTAQYQCTNDWEKCNPCYYTPQSYMLMGKSILICILDLFHLNPYSRITNTQNKSIDNIRKIISTQIYTNNQKFRMIDGLLSKKMRELTQYIDQNYYKPRFLEYGLSISENHNKYKKKTQSLNSKLHIPNNSRNSMYHKKLYLQHESEFEGYGKKNRQRIQIYDEIQTQMIPDSARSILSSKMNKSPKNTKNMQIRKLQLNQQTRYKSSDKLLIQTNQQYQKQKNQKKPAGTIKAIKLLQKTQQKQTIHRSRSMRISLFLKKSHSAPKEQHIKQKLNKPQNNKQKNIMALSGYKNFVFPNLKISTK